LGKNNERRQIKDEKMINPDYFGIVFVTFGYVVGFGAVIVIDILGLLGRKNPYWTETTIRSHKVTKRLIWVGIILIIIGNLLLYGKGDFDNYFTFQFVLIAIMIINGLFLSFKISPYLLKREKDGLARETLPADIQRKIATSLIFSDLGWIISLIAYCLFIYRNLSF
jgi:hypothetical protein